MHWDDEGFLISKSRYNENSIIADVFTLNHGKTSGIIYGGTSRKIKNYLQLGNKIYVDFKSKNENKLGFFKIEIIEAISPFFYGDKKRLNCLVASLNLLKIVLPDLQKNRNIFMIFLHFVNKLKHNDNWIVDYIFWEINLLKELGFDMNLKMRTLRKLNANNDVVSINIDDQQVNIPYFLIDMMPDKIHSGSINLALKFIRKYLEKKILIPNNLTYPTSGTILENSFYNGRT